MSGADQRCDGIVAIVLAKNEASNLRRCLEALRWADEVVVVDDHSEDATVQIARECGARVETHRFESFAAQRNWALDHGQLRHRWALMLDADEICTGQFASEIREAVQNASDDTVAFKTCRKTMLDGTWLKYSDGFPVWIMRVVRCGRAYFQDSGHGEVPVPDVDGTIDTIEAPFIHEAFSRGMDDWWTRHVRYAKKEAAREQMTVEGVSSLSIFSLDRSRRRKALRRLSRRLPARGTLRFLYQYVIKQGFRDGNAGYRFCKMMACYETMIAIRKLEPGITGVATQTENVTK